jgi:hypothetical protein
VCVLAHCRDGVAVDAVVAVHLGSPPCRYEEGVVGDHAVTLGPSQPCEGLVWVSDSELACIPSGVFYVGPLNITLSVDGDLVTTSGVVTAKCPKGQFGVRTDSWLVSRPPHPNLQCDQRSVGTFPQAYTGLMLVDTFLLSHISSVSLSLPAPVFVSVSVFVVCLCASAFWLLWPWQREGDLCAGCPNGAECPGGDLDPVALPGFFPVTRASFVTCVPLAACSGGVNGSVAANGGEAGCGQYYRGARCGSCRQGAYLRAGECHKCPNTAWLLFLSFALAIVAAVAAAVYVTKKRVNLAGLSIGVVRVCMCACVHVCMRWLAQTVPSHSSVTLLCTQNPPAGVAQVCDQNCRPLLRRCWGVFCCCRGQVTHSPNGGCVVLTYSHAPILPPPPAPTHAHTLPTPHTHYLPHPSPLISGHLVSSSPACRTSCKC